MGTGIFLEYGADVGSFKGNRGYELVLILRRQRFSLVALLTRRRIRFSLVPAREAIAVFGVGPKVYIYAFAYKVVG
jgi:hypothetical protein